MQHVNVPQPLQPRLQAGLLLKLCLNIAQTLGNQHELILKGKLKKLVKRPRHYMPIFNEQLESRVLLNLQILREQLTKLACTIRP